MIIPEAMETIATPMKTEEVVSPKSQLATPAEVAEALHTTEQGLAQMRFKGTGAPFVKIGRRVLYRWADVEAYIEANVMTRTDDRPGAA